MTFLFTPFIGALRPPPWARGMLFPRMNPTILSTLDQNDKMRYVVERIRYIAHDKHRLDLVLRCG